MRPPSEEANLGVSVVIPTLGRDALSRAVRSAVEQLPAPLEVIVVDDSGDGVPLPVTGGLVRTIRTEGRRGPSAARNAGMSAARGDFVALLDDDDEYLPGHLELAVRTLAKSPAAGIFSSSALVRSGTSGTVSPERVYKGRKPLVEHLYGNDAWFTAQRRILTPTLVFHRHVADHLFDERRSVFEDTLWLLEQEALGRRLVQVEDVTVVVNSDDSRVSERGGLDTAFEWGQRLEALSPSAGVNYLVGVVGRDLARRGGLPEFQRFKDAVHRLPLRRQAKLVLLAEELYLRVLRR